MFALAKIRFFHFFLVISVSFAISAEASLQLNTVLKSEACQQISRMAADLSEANIVYLECLQQREIVDQLGYKRIKGTDYLIDLRIRLSLGGKTCILFASRTVYRKYTEMDEEYAQINDWFIWQNRRQPLCR